jgi:hypothetical protein
MRLRLIAACVVALALPVSFACSDGDDDDTTPDGTTATDTASTDTATSTAPSTAALSDEEYLKVFCEGLTEYQEAIETEPDVDKIADIVRDYAAAMDEVNPPEDLVSFNDAYVAYLEEAVDDPTSLVATSPPEPDEGPRDRLAGKVDDVPECKYPTFLGDGQ